MHIHIHHEPPRTSQFEQQTLQLLTAMQASLATLGKTSTQEKQIMSQLSDKVDALKASVAAENTVIDSAVTAFKGVPALIQDAFDKAVAAGATPEQLAALDALKTTVDSEAAALAEAIVSGTPAGDPPPPPPPTGV